MKLIFRYYFKTSLVLRILVCFALGAVLGGLLWYASRTAESRLADKIMPYVSPFGDVFVDMLKMIVIPVIFFSLIVGAAGLPVKRFGRVGLKTLGWYLSCSILAALVGVALALLINPGSGTELDQWQQMAQAAGQTARDITDISETQSTLTQILLNLFKNPFEALTTGNFLPIIVFAILFGLAVRITLESTTDPKATSRLNLLIDFAAAARDAMFKIVDWILEYSPIGVLALTIKNFGLYGPSIVGPYVSVTLGIIIGILAMIFIVYSLLLWTLTRQNPLTIFKRIQEAMIMAFITRSSAATLPVSIKTAREELKVHNDLAGFSLPLGATINMDGVCVHLPMFAVLAANMFNMQLTTAGLFILVITTVLASIGAGGVPGGSLMLLFIILQTMNLTPDQVAVVVALALGINPILDMFETMNNVTGDLVCTFAVAHNEGLIDSTTPT